MLPRQLPASLLVLGLLMGTLLLRPHSKDAEESPEASATTISAEPESQGSKEPHLGIAEADRGIEEAPVPAEPGPSLDSMAEAVRSATTITQVGEWADRIAAVGGREAVEHLVALALGERDEGRSGAILEAFKGLSDPQDILVLASVVTATTDFRVLEAATEMIGRSGTPEVVDYLAELSRQEPLQSTQRTASLWMIERIENPSALRGLAKLVTRAPEADLAAAAAVALARLGGALADSTLSDAASAHPQDNPEFQQLVQNALIHRAPDSSDSAPPASWALAEGSAP